MPAGLKTLNFVIEYCSADLNVKIESHPEEDQGGFLYLMDAEEREEHEREREEYLSEYRKFSKQTLTSLLFEAALIAAASGHNDLIDEAIAQGRERGNRIFASLNEKED